jgi:hypothetical protein
MYALKMETNERRYEIDMYLSDSIWTSLVSKSKVSGKRIAIAYRATEKRLLLVDCIKHGIR